MTLRHPPQDLKFQKLPRVFAKVSDEQIIDACVEFQQLCRAWRSGDGSTRGMYVGDFLNFLHDWETDPTRAEGNSSHGTDVEREIEMSRHFAGALLETRTELEGVEFASPADAQAAREEIFKVMLGRSFDR